MSIVDEFVCDKVASKPALMKAESWISKAFHRAGRIPANLNWAFLRVAIGALLLSYFALLALFSIQDTYPLWVIRAVVLLNIAFTVYMANNDFPLDKDKPYYLFTKGFRTLFVLTVVVILLDGLDNSIVQMDDGWYTHTEFMK